MALTLRSVAGLTVPEIARAFLSSEVRWSGGSAGAQQGDRCADPFAVPSDDLLPERLAGVLRVVYLTSPRWSRGHGRRLARCAATCATRRSGSLGCSCG